MPETDEQYIYSDLLTMIKEGRVAELQVISTDANVKLVDGTEFTVVTPGYTAIYLSAGADIESQIAAGTLKSILEQANVELEEFSKYL